MAAGPARAQGLAVSPISPRGTTTQQAVDQIKPLRDASAAHTTSRGGLPPGQRVGSRALGTGGRADPRPLRAPTSRRQRVRSSPGRDRSAHGRATGAGPRRDVARSAAISLTPSRRVARASHSFTVWKIRGLSGDARRSLKTPARRCRVSNSRGNSTHAGHRSIWHRSCYVSPPTSATVAGQPAGAGRTIRSRDRNRRWPFGHAVRERRRDGPKAIAT
jgi:hypothetical protein